MKEVGVYVDYIPNKNLSKKSSTLKSFAHLVV